MGKVFTNTPKIYKYFKDSRGVSESIFFTVNDSRLNHVHFQGHDVTSTRNMGVNCFNDSQTLIILSRRSNTKKVKTNIHICFAKNFQLFFIEMSVLRCRQYPGCQRLFMRSFQFPSLLCSDTPTPKHSSACGGKKFFSTWDMYAKTCMSFKN